MLAKNGHSASGKEMHLTAITELVKQDINQESKMINLRELSNSPI